MSTLAEIETADDLLSSEEKVNIDIVSRAGR
jgi:hypothetical protein